MALYPEITPFSQRHLDVGDGHRLHLEQCGNPRGLPVVVLHGGPGGSTSPRMRRYFDPALWHIILFDQRGAGRSLPAADITANTTDHLLEDMERIREALGIDRWLVFGGSWGATLGLLYAQSRPERTTGLLLRGTFLFRRRDLDWIFRGGVSRIFPDAWEAFVSPIPEDERADMVAAYHRRLCGEVDADRETLAGRWAGWEAACSTLRPNAALRAGYQENATAMARIECHYSMHDGFIAENRILDNMDRLADIPGYIVHGRYDMVCPLEQSMLVHRRWPGSVLEIIDDAGHSALEPGIEKALVAAVEKMKDRARA